MQRPLVNEGHWASSSSSSYSFIKQQTGKCPACPFQTTALDQNNTGYLATAGAVLMLALCTVEKRHCADNFYGL